MWDDVLDAMYWMAPKVEETMYGPIEADRWSCRRVLLYILDELRKEDEHLKAIGRQLKAQHSKQRRSLQ